jgi:flap endonuclease-1
MGIKDLNKFIKKHCPECIKEKTIKDFKNKNICIDTSIFLYKYKYLYDNFLIGFVEQIVHLLKNDVTPIYLFDGKPSEEKNITIESRREEYQNKNKKIENNDNEVLNMQREIELLTMDINNDNRKEIEKKVKTMKKEIKKIKTNNDKMKKSKIKISQVDINSLKQLFDLCGIFYYQCDGESDIFCRLFFNNKLVDSVITEDMDYLTHGCKNIIRNYHPKSNKIEEYQVLTLLENMKLSYRSFIDLCILMGCDYVKRIKGIGPEKALKIITEYGGIKNYIENKKDKVEIPDNYLDKYNNACNMFTCEDYDFDISFKDLRNKYKKSNKERIEFFFKQKNLSETKLKELMKIFNKKSKKMNNNILNYLRK